MENEIEIDIYDMDVSPWGMAGTNLCGSIIDRLLGEGADALEDEMEGLPLPVGGEGGHSGVGADPFSVSAEFQLVWGALAESPFSDAEGRARPLRKLDPSRRLASGVTVDKVSDQVAQRAFSLFCVWLGRWADPEGSFPIARPDEPLRSRLDALIGQEAWPMPWVDKLGFARWAWSKGLLLPRNGWQAWEVLDPYAGHILERPLPVLSPVGGDEYSTSYLERVMKKKNENKGEGHE